MLVLPCSRVARQCSEGVTQSITHVLAVLGLEPRTLPKDRATVAPPSSSTFFKSLWILMLTSLSVFIPVSVRWSCCRSWFHNRLDVGWIRRSSSQNSFPSNWKLTDKGKTHPLKVKGSSLWLKYPVFQNLCEFFLNPERPTETQSRRELITVMIIFRSFWNSAGHCGSASARTTPCSHTL